jgi:hypothetical protein
MSDTLHSPATQEAGRWAGIVMLTPDGNQRFQNELMSAERNGDDPLRAVSLAYAALLVANTEDAGLFASWYRDKAMLLLCRASEVMAAIGKRDGEAVN